MGLLSLIINDFSSSRLYEDSEEEDTLAVSNMNHLPSPDLTDDGF